MDVRHLTSGERYEDYARRFDGPMLILAGLFLVIWTYDSLDASFSPRVDVALVVARSLIWVVFGVDLVIRIVIAKSSWRFVIHHPLDVLAVVIPPLRPLKILTIFTQGTRLVTSRGVLQTGQAVVASAALLVWVGAVAIYNAESGVAAAKIVSFGDALWWAVVTITTVGYGDITPVTVEGRVIAVGLMIVGIALLGVVTASVAAWFVRLTGDREDEEKAAQSAAADADVARLESKVERLEAKIDRLLERE